MMSNKKLKKGQIVLMPFPFTNLSGSKLRPALILNTSLSDDIIVCFISSKSEKVRKGEFLVKPDSANCLKKKSKIICSKIATLDKKIILGKIGELSDTDLKKVNEIIKQIFGI